MMSNDVDLRDLAVDRPWQKPDQEWPCVRDEMYSPAMFCPQRITDRVSGSGPVGLEGHAVCLRGR